MLVRRFAKSHRGRHQKCEPEMPRICPWVDFGRTPFEMTDQLQNPAEAECDAVFEDPYRLRTKHFGVPASSFLERAARHRDVRDVASRNYPGVVQQAVGELEFGHVAINGSQQEKRISNGVSVARFYLFGMTNVNIRSPKRANLLLQRT